MRRVFCHPRRWRRRHHHMRVALVLGTFAVELIHQEVIHMATELKVGQTLPLSIAFFDQKGDPMAAAPKPDMPPEWANIPSSADSLSAAPDGMTANLNALAAGTDTVRLRVLVNGQSFEATVDLSISGAGTPSQTLTSVGIVVGTPT